MRLPRLLVFIVAVGVARGDGVCPAGAIYNSQLDKCYTYVSSPRQWTLAEQDCIALGGHLTSIRNGFENTLISGKEKFFRSTVSENAVQIFIGGNTSDFWSGGNDLTVTGTWTWNDGQAFVYSNWAPG